MKKFICLLLTVCVLMSMGIVYVGADAADDMALLYDFALNKNVKDEETDTYVLTSDGVVDTNDARAVMRVAAGIETPRAGINYDVDGDGVLSNRDAKKLLCIIVGIDESTASDEEYQLARFSKELNAVKTQRPGFTKNTTYACTDMRITTTGAPEDKFILGLMGIDTLNVTNMDFVEYADMLIKVGEKAGASDSKEMQELRKQRDTLYIPKTDTRTVKKRYSHKAQFPIYSEDYACALTMDDIKSITCVDDGDYIIRTVTLNEEAFGKGEFPVDEDERLTKVKHAKVFSIPKLKEDVDILENLRFYEGKVVIKTSKLTGMPESATYEYKYYVETYSEDISEDGSKMTTRMKSYYTSLEEFAINSLEVK